MQLCLRFRASLPWLQELDDFHLIWQRCAARDVGGVHAFTLSGAQIENDCFILSIKFGGMMGVFFFFSRQFHPGVAGLRLQTIKVVKQSKLKAP